MYSLLSEPAQDEQQDGNKEAKKVKKKKTKIGKNLEKK